jgi:hypothetical protein
LEAGQPAHEAAELVGGVRSARLQADRVAWEAAEASVNAQGKSTLDAISDLTAAIQLR